MELVRNNKLNLANGWALSRLSVEKQNEFLNRAMTTDPEKFVPLLNEHLKTKT